jgi:hypothetical protein
MQASDLFFAAGRGAEGGMSVTAEDVRGIVFLAAGDVA